VTTTPVLEIAERALRHLGGEGQATVVHERSLTSRFARSEPTQATDVDDITIHLLSVEEGHTGAATVNSVDDTELSDAGAKAREAARAARRAGPGDYPGLPDPAGVREHEGYDPGTAALDPGQAGAALEATFAAADEHHLEAFGIWSAGEVRTAIASTRGVRTEDALTDAYMRVICRDSEGRAGFASDASTTSRQLDGPALAHRAAAKVSAQEPATLPPGEYTVVLEAEAVGTLLEFLGDLAFNGLAYAEGRGALAGRLGTQVAAPQIYLADSPRYPCTLPRSFDCEGVPKSPIPLIQDGIAYRVAHDRRSAARAGVGAEASTGHALAPGGSPDGPRPTNLVLTGGGAADEQELMAGVERGLYVTRLWYVNSVHDKQTLLTGVTREGTFLIEDGQITRPVRDLRFTDSVLRLLAHTDELTAHQHLVCAGDFYGRRFATGVVCPALRAYGFRVTGAAV
jgi:predicted Zn-dependent protease